MKKLLTLLTILITTTSFSQVIVKDKIDDFTDIRSILIQNSIDNEIQQIDNIALDTKDIIILSLQLNKHPDYEITKTLIISMLLKDTKCFNKSELSLLFENGEKFTLNQYTSAKCEKALIVGYTLSDMHFVLAKNNLLKKIRITNTSGHTDYNINPKQQENIKKTLQLSFNKYQEIKQ